MDTLEDRVAALENEVMQIKRFLTTVKRQDSISPWEKMFGSFADSEGFDEAVRLGREYRESLRPKDEDEPS